MTHWLTFFSSKKKTRASWHLGEPFSDLERKSVHDTLANLLKFSKENQCMTHWRTFFSSKKKISAWHIGEPFSVLKRKPVHHDTGVNLFPFLKKISAWHIGEPFSVLKRKPVHDTLAKWHIGETFSVLKRKHVHDTLVNLCQFSKENQCMTHWRNFFSSKKKISAWHIG